MKTVLLIISSSITFQQNPETLQKERIEYYSKERVCIEEVDDVCYEDEYEETKVYFLEPSEE